MLLKTAYIFLTLACFSCLIQEEQANAFSLPSQDLDSLIVWRVPLHEDTLEVLSVPVLVQENKIITSAFPLQANKNETLICLNDKGTLEWQWEAYIPQHNFQRLDNVALVSDEIFLSSRADNYSLNINSGEKNWEFFHDQGDPVIYTTDSKVYKVLSYGVNNKSDSTTLLMADYLTGDFEEIFKLKKMDDFEARISGVLGYTNNLGQEILVFQNRQLRINPFSNRISLYSYNLTTKELMWTLEKIDDLDSNFRAPIEAEDHIYFAGQHKMFSIEKGTGKISWEKKFHHDFQGSNYLVYQNLIITNLDNGDLIAIRKDSGNTVWIKEQLTGCCTELRIKSDKLYLANGDLFIIDPLNGNTIFQFKTPTVNEPLRSGALFLNAIAVDDEEQRMFATDGYYLYCLKHP